MRKVFSDFLLIIGHLPLGLGRYLFINGCNSINGAQVCVCMLYSKYILIYFPQ
jgi:hypothetical protein